MALKNVMSIGEASERWGISPTTLKQNCSGQRGNPPRFPEGEFNKSNNIWLVTEEGMMRMYGLNKEQLKIMADRLVEEYRYDFDRVMEVASEYTTINREALVQGGEEKLVWLFFDNIEDRTQVYVVDEDRFLNDKEIVKFWEGK